ncbi:hypothetical protein GF339_03715 [candidate division KSB3 bacterium]|uniref:Type I restriction enzyme R protein N-terminal domain-containing protein n=1 Tax=candidate division KSB3 bacterium TaxID=2044937 RepID=A0A9D5JT79_9BACT|nr:hypothetical protein [candidate division KSB3 bacterium]MBD3323665.1 hypothetical protein [candidate division KSB3 bacterium]
MNRMFRSLAVCLILGIGVGLVVSPLTLAQQYCISQDFTRNIQAIASRVQRIDTDDYDLYKERTVEHIIVIPLIKVLGYDDMNPEEVRLQYTISNVDNDDDGNDDKGYPDIVVFKKDDKNKKAKPFMIFECKRLNTGTSTSEFVESREQLSNYLRGTQAPVGVLTNGRIYRFYLYRKEKCTMDTTPFLEIDFEDIGQRGNNIIPMLWPFRKASSFDTDKIQERATKLLEVKAEVKSYLAKQFDSPTKEFLQCIYAQALKEHAKEAGEANAEAMFFLIRQALYEIAKEFHVQ